MLFFRQLICMKRSADNYPFICPILGWRELKIPKEFVVPSYRTGAESLLSLKSCFASNSFLRYATK